MSTFTTADGVRYAGVQARTIAAKAGSNKFKTRIENVRWREEYSVSFDGKNYNVSRSRSVGRPDWSYTVSSVTANDSRWCDPDKPTHKRVVAALKQIIDG